MSERADAVIIGGGIIGAAVAFYLARERVGRVILLEKEPFLGSGATAKAAGGIRAQFSTQVNISMSMLSETLFERFADDTGYHALFDQVGYLFLATNETDAAAYMQHNALQRSLGLDARIVTPDDIRGIAPHARVDDVILGTYCPKDGLGDPYEFLSGYIEAARRMGVEVRLESPVNGIDIRGEKVRGVTAPTGKIETGIVINCAGPY